MKKILYLTLVVAVTLTASGQQVFDARGFIFRDPENIWVEETLQKLSLGQRIAQLMVVRVPLDMNDKQAKEVSDRMNGYGVGGVCFFVGTAERQASMTRLFQQDARVPLLVCIDGEWGLGMRLKDMYSFPRNARFGKLPADADSIVYRVGEEIGHQCREMGIHINFAPVVDINSNPKNPVIGTRSFGTDRERVAQLGIMYALGMQSQGVMATAKHFPGHGDTDKDSHLELPVINHTPAYIDSIDLYPFKRLIDAGVQGVMVAHLQVNALDPVRPSSLSPAIVDGLLRKKLGFSGLIITDGLDMKGVTNTYGEGRGELEALKAGNDILLLPPDVAQAIETIKTAAEADKEVRAMVDEHCRRVLHAKYRHVMPYLSDSIRVPGEEHRAVCQRIVDDLDSTLLYHAFATDSRIDSLAQAAIAAQATPGCQVVALYKGRMVLNKAYGHQTYDPASSAVDSETLYDVASLTKVCATTLAVMRLVDEGKLSIDDRLSKFLSYLDSTDKRNITVKQAMSHCARLKAFDAYWQQTSSRDSILLAVAASPLNAREGYLYSDLGFMLLSDVVLRLTGMPLDQYCAEHFYRPMGLKNTLFNPLQHDTCLRRLAPTEQDTLRGLVHGQVHDPNAYAMGGVSGHAGLFSTACEVARLMQMLLDGGVYNGQRYLSKETIDLFTSRHYVTVGNRRALGFDKPLINGGAGGPCCAEASQASYGHTGFTGTMLWVDPEHELVYVFLSNRVHPSATPNRLAQMNIRTDIQSVLYKILKHE